MLGRWRSMVRLALGVAVWAAVFAFGLRLWASGTVQSYEPVEQFSQFFFEPHFEVDVAFPARVDPKPGTRVHYREPGGIPEALGEVVRVRQRPNAGTTVTIWVYPNQRTHVTRDLRFVAEPPPASFAQVLDTLLDDRAKAEVEELWAAFVERHEAEITGLIGPYLERRMQAYLAVIQPALRDAISDAQPRFEALLDRHYRETITPDVLPTVQARFWEYATERFTPKLRAIGQELYEAMPVTSLGLNYLRDRLVPFEAPTNVVARFEKYVREQGLPIIRRHEPALMRLFEATVRDAAYDLDITEVVHDAIDTMLADPDLSEILSDIVVTAIVENDASARFMEQTWADPELQWRIARIGSMMEWWLTRAINAVVLDEDGTGINPNLVIVLRRQVFWKHETRFVAYAPAVDETDASAPAFVSEGHTFAGSHGR